MTVDSLARVRRELIETIDRLVAPCFTDPTAAEREVAVLLRVADAVRVAGPPGDWDGLLDLLTEAARHSPAAFLAVSASVGTAAEDWEQSGRAPTQAQWSALRRLVETVAGAVEATGYRAPDSGPVGYLSPPQLEVYRRKVAEVLKEGGR